MKYHSNSKSKIRYDAFDLNESKFNKEEIMDDQNFTSKFDIQPLPT